VRSPYAVCDTRADCGKRLRIGMQQLAGASSSSAVGVHEVTRSCSLRDAHSHTRCAFSFNDLSAIGRESTLREAGGRVAGRKPFPRGSAGDDSQSAAFS